MDGALNLLTPYPALHHGHPPEHLNSPPLAKNVARRFGREFFDGPRQYGYGGYRYDARMWEAIARDIARHYRLTPSSRVLDVGCAKGFFLHALRVLIPGITVAGVDISPYALAHAKPDVRPCLAAASADRLPFPDNSFDLTVSIATLHNLPEPLCRRAIREVERVSRRDKYITVDAYRTEAEREALYKNNLTGHTLLHRDRWRELLRDEGYRGNHYMFYPRSCVPETGRQVKK